MPGQYVAGIGPSSGTAPTSVLTLFDQWVLDKNLDDGCTFTFNSPGNSLPGLAIVELETDIWLYLDSILVERFRVIRVDKTWDYDGRNTITVQCVCYRRLLGSRYVQSQLSYTGVLQGQIVWNLIQHTQAQTNGNLGITLGTVGSSSPLVERDRVYLPGANILEAILSLAEIDNGFTWDINQDLELYIFDASSYALKPQPIVLGTNAVRMSRPSGADLYGNVGLATGDTLVTTMEIAQSPTLATDPKGRWERYRSSPSEQSQISLQQIAEGVLVEANSPDVVWQIEIDPVRFFTDSDYELGDYVLIVAPDDVVPTASDPSIPLLVRDNGMQFAQVVAERISLSASGEVQAQINAVQVLQRYNDVPSAIRWVDADPTLTWLDLLSTVLL